MSNTNDATPHAHPAGNASDGPDQITAARMALLALGEPLLRELADGLNGAEAEAALAAGGGGKVEQFLVNPNNRDHSFKVVMSIQAVSLSDEDLEELRNDPDVETDVAFVAGNADGATAYSIGSSEAAHDVANGGVPDFSRIDRDREDRSAKEDYANSLHGAAEVFEAAILSIAQGLKMRPVDVLHACTMMLARLGVKSANDGCIPNVMDEIVDRVRRMCGVLAAKAPELERMRKESAAREKADAEAEAGAKAMKPADSFTDMMERLRAMKPGGNA